MDDQPVSPEVAAQPAPETPVPEAAPESAAAQTTPPPFWASRKYVGRAFGFRWQDHEIEGSFYQHDGGIDCDGLVDGSEYESTADLLVKMAVPSDRRAEVTDRIRRFLT